MLISVVAVEQTVNCFAQNLLPCWDINVGHWVLVTSNGPYMLSSSSIVVMTTVVMKTNMQSCGQQLVPCSTWRKSDHKGHLTGDADRDENVFVDCKLKSLRIHHETVLHFVKIAHEHSNSTDAWLTSYAYNHTTRSALNILLLGLDMYVRLNLRTLMYCAKYMIKFLSVHASAYK